MDTVKKLYSYNGSVMMFDTCIERSWKASTWAISDKKAKSNLIFRYKNEHDLARNAKISLPDKITMED